VTHVAANVPALSDHFGHRVGRANGWPNWVWDPASAQAESAAYYDAAFFAQHIRVPTLVGVGLADVTCSPSSVYAAWNALGGPKDIVVGPTSGHEGPPDWSARLATWLDM
jgi:cephalosporin-C deacetylase